MEKFKGLFKRRVTMDRAVWQTVRRYNDPPFEVSAQGWYTLPDAAREALNGFRGSPAKKLERLIKQARVVPDHVAEQVIYRLHEEPSDVVISQLAVDILTSEVKLRHPNTADSERKRSYVHSRLARSNRRN